MKKARIHQENEAVELYPTSKVCPVCQESLSERYRKRRWIVTLKGMVRVTSHVLECQTRLSLAQKLPQSFLSIHDW